MRSRVLASAFVATMLLGTADLARSAPSTPPPLVSQECVAGSTHSLRSDTLSYAGTARRPLHASRALAGREAVRFGTRNLNGVATVFGVVARRVDVRCRSTYYKVQLPVRPNGSTGWVRAADIRLRPVRTRIEVELSERRVTVFRNGRPVLEATAAIGRPSTPTPTGRYYVNQRLLAANPKGAFGVGAVGVSAFSPVLVNWAQGGPIAFHGTNAPHLIGQAVTYGCLRLHDADIRALLRLAEEGTPVTISR